MSKKPRSLLVFCAIPLISLMFGVTTASADEVTVYFSMNGELWGVQRTVPTGSSLIEAAMVELVAGPTAEELNAGVTSQIPVDAKIISLDVSADSVSVDLSPEILQGLDEAGLTNVFNQFRGTLASFSEIQSIRLTSEGQLLSSYLPPAPVIEPAPEEGPQPMPMAAEAEGEGPIILAGSALSGRNITIGPSHGRIWNGSGWYWQRSDPCGFGEAVLEDTNSVRLCQFLYQYLAQDGAAVHVARELNESNCCNGDTGLAWWKMCSQSWLRINGLPCSVWASYSGNCGGDTATSRSSDDIRARPLFADYRGSNIYIAHHTNAGGGGTANGTETFRDTAMEHPAHVGNSYNLALSVNNNVINAIREMYDGAWSNRGVKDAAGGFGEIRIPDRPAILIELAFHDNCSRDAAYLTDNFFRSVSEWGLYKGVCEYFGTSPTYDRYSDDYVSDTIPTTMTQGQVYNVSVTFRNRGVVWTTARNFRLGAAGDSDPFTAFTRVDISGEVGPGNTYTFNFQMTAPAAGDYVSDWRMVRDAVAWFGATLTKNIHVVPNIVDTEPPTTPTNLVAAATGPTSIQLNWTASTDNVGVNGYDIRRNGAIIAQSPTNSFTDNTVSPGTAYTYEVRAYDAASNQSGFSNSASPTTPTAPVIVFSDGFNGDLSNWVQLSQNFDYSTAVNHGTYVGGGAAYCNAGGTDLMYHQFSRPFAQGKTWGWFWDGKGGWKAGVCGNQYRQALSLRDTNGAAKMYIDNELYSPIGSNSYGYRVLNSAGGAHTIYGTRDPATDCNGTWVYFETTVTAGAPGGVGSIQLKVTDRAGTSTATPGMQADFYDWGIGRLTIGLGNSSTNDCYWDDIAFEASPPGPPSMSSPTAPSTTQIQWNFSRADNNLFGFEVADAAGTSVSPLYPNSGWINRSGTSWIESGLAANTQYTRKVRAWNGTLNGTYSTTASAHTLSAAPGTGSVTPDKASACPGENITWTAVGGFGPGTVQYYKYAWDQTPTHTFNGTEAVWSSGTLVLQMSAGGSAWYLHVQGYNGADAANGSYDYSVTFNPTSPADFDDDCDVDQVDYAAFSLCASGPGIAYGAGCSDKDLDTDGDVDQTDFAVFQRCYSGENVPAAPNCAD